MCNLRFPFVKLVTVNNLWKAKMVGYLERREELGRDDRIWIFVEKGVLRAGGLSNSEVSKPEFQQDGSNSTAQDSVIGQEVREVVIKPGSSSESLGETGNKPPKCLSPSPRYSE